jgi:putative PIN family toxin of toxin-antitoxin system
VLVFDTNIWVSYALNPNSELASTVDRGINQFAYALSNRTFTELTDVLMRAKFEPYFSIEKRAHTLKCIAQDAQWFSPKESIHDCRDPKDNKFLELIISAKAKYLITSDEDLLVLDPFRKTRILTTAHFSTKLS